MFQMLAYIGNNSTPSNNFDLTALTDPSFSIRNGHYIFTEDYLFDYITAFSAHITDATIRSPLINALSTDGLRIAGFNVTAGLGGAPTLLDRWRQIPYPVPKMEEVQFLASTGTIEQQFGIMVLRTPGFTTNLPAGIPVVLEATTGSFTPTARVWSADQALTFNSNPRGGVYAVVGASCQQAADTLAFRINFPRTKLYMGRKLYPGWFAQNVVGSFEDVITQYNRFHMGVWGYFHTFEPPLLSVLPSTAAAMTPILRLWCVYMGADESLVNSLYAQMN